MEWTKKGERPSLKLGAESRAGSRRKGQVDTRVGDCNGQPKSPDVLRPRVNQPGRCRTRRVVTVATTHLPTGVGSTAGVLDPRPLAAAPSPDPTGSLTPQTPVERPVWEPGGCS